MSRLHTLESRLLAELTHLRGRVADLESQETEYQRTVAALVQSEAKFRKIAEKGGVGVYLVQDGVFRYVNPRLARTFGYGIEELINKRGPEALVYPEDWPMVEEHLRNRISGAVDTVNFQFRGIKKDGDIIHVEVYGSRLHYDDRPAVIGTLLDITERLQARRDLESEVNKFQALYELALAMTAEPRLDENLALVVAKGREILGADATFLALRDETTGELCICESSGIITDAFKRFRRPMEFGPEGEVATTGQPRVVKDYVNEAGPEFRDIVRGEGLRSGIVVPIAIEKSNLGILAAFNRDGSEFTGPNLDTLTLLGNLAAVEINRKRADVRLMQSQQQYRKLYEESKRNEELYLSLLNSSADAIVIYDLEGRAKYVNPAFTAIFGWTMEEVQGRQIPFLPESEREATMRVIFGLIRDGIPCSGFETRRYTKDGRLLDVSVSASCNHDLRGDPSGTLVIIRDITDRKRSDEALRQSEERYRELYAESERRRELYRTLLDVSPDPIVVYDTKGIPTYANPAFSSVFGWDFRDMEGKRIDFVPPENWPETNEMINKVMHGINFSDQESRRYTRDGRVIDVSISGAVLPDKSGKPSGSVVHLRDITARKRAEANLAAGLRKFQALYDLALVMIAERSLEENLHTVVDTGRKLLGADKAFLALRDDKTDELCMHTMSGIVTEAFRELRIPFGVGLGGKVAVTRQPHVVEDYFREVGPELHDVVRGEGLVSGIAVPVKMGETTLGVLYAFNRERTPFSKPDLDTLSLLGNLAAVEIAGKRSEERLKESEQSYRVLYAKSTVRKELYRSLLHSSADAIVIYDMDGKTQYVSPSFTRIFGWTLDELVGRRIPFLPDSERETSMRIINGVIRDGAPCSGFETRRLTKDGRLLDISISSSRYHDHEGKPAGMLVSLRDITDRKRAEAQLKESEKRFRTLAEVAPIGLVMLAPDGTTEYISPKFTETFGYTSDDLPDAESWFLNAYPDEKSRRRAAVVWREEAAEMKVKYGIGAEASPRIFKVRCKDGSVKIASFRAVILAEGSFIATFLDITAEARAQAEIVRAKDEWERTFNAVSDLILILDAQRRIVRVNKAVADRMGTVPEQMIGLSCAEWDRADLAPLSLCPDTTTIPEGSENSHEVVDEVLGGVFDLRVAPLRDEKGAVLGSVNVARDITAIKSIERARRLAVHHLSHELNTPLAVIKASVTNLEDKTLSPETTQRNLDRIRRNLQRLSDIQQSVQEIVAPSEDRPRYFPIVPTINQVLDDILAEGAHRLVTVTRRLDPVETDIIDPEILARVLRTLVKNAIENTPDEGEIVVSFGEDASGFLLQVRDRGVGITMSDREFLFKAFHHTQDTYRYATKTPFDFNAGGKALELMRLKILSEEGRFSIWFETQRCRYLPTNLDLCPGRISLCSHVSDAEGCKQSGGTTFSVLFPKRAG